jgi:hypothetical protein
VPEGRVPPERAGEGAARLALREPARRDQGAVADLGSDRGGLLRVGEAGLDTARTGDGARTSASRNAAGSFAPGAIPSSPRWADQTAARASKARAAASQMAIARSSSVVTR